MYLINIAFTYSITMYLPKSKQINTAMCRGGSGMENVRVIDLKVDNIVQFQASFKGITAMQTAIVNHVCQRFENSLVCKRIKGLITTFYQVCRG